MYDIRLLGLDLDGTVFDDRKNISARTVAAIAEACRRGVTVVPATGRTVSGVPERFSGIAGVRYALISNGAAVVELGTRKTLVSLPFAPDDALRLYDLLLKFGGMISVFAGGESYTAAADTALTATHVPENLREYFRTTRIEVTDMHATLRALAQTVEKYSILYRTEAERDAAWQAVAAAFPDCMLTASLPCNMEVNAKGVTKGRGLLALAAHLGLRREQVMAVGDSGNDLAMLRDAGLGVAMGNATAEVKAAADAVTADNNHDGVAEAIERYVLRTEA